jgi:hypothetical protein
MAIVYPYWGWWTSGHRWEHPQKPSICSNMMQGRCQFWVLPVAPFSVPRGPACLRRPIPFEESDKSQTSRNASTLFCLTWKQTPLEKGGLTLLLIPPTVHPVNANKGLLHSHSLNLRSDPQLGKGLHFPVQAMGLVKVMFFLIFSFHQWLRLHSKTIVNFSAHKFYEGPAQQKSAHF